MAFRKYKDIGEVLKAFDIQYQEAHFISIDLNLKAPLSLVEEIQFVTENLPYKVSEASIGEMIIFPILKEVWKNFNQKLMLWSHKSINYSKEFNGIPDYLIARYSKLGKVVLDKPLLAVIEAKKDDFEGGWAQCTLEMYTMQKINGNVDIPVYGIVSNGDNWEFGQLHKNVLMQQPQATSLFPIDHLYAQLYVLMDECVKYSNNL
jgi:hypothetical protein